MQKRGCLILFTFMLSKQHMVIIPCLFYSFFCCVFRCLCVAGICTGHRFLFPSYHAGSQQQQLPKAFAVGPGYMTLVCHSRATTLSIHTGKVKSASISHIYIWTKHSPVGWLWPSKYSTWCKAKVMHSTSGLLKLVTNPVWYIISQANCSSQLNRP